jgi:transposase InsO family protein
MASSRIKRWALLLAAYDYTIQYLPGKDNRCADYLSRNPIEGKPTVAEKVTVNVLFTHHDEIIRADVVAAETKKDQILRAVMYNTKHGWTETPTQELIPYYNKRLEITNENDILIWNDRVVIPSSLREMLLKDLHTEHLGIVKTKQLARMYIWWPNIDRDIEHQVKSCQICQETAKSPPDTRQACWSWPTGPWKRLHLDFAGPFEGKMFLVVIDAYSKYLDVIPMTTANSSNTIAALRHLFSHFGLPDHVVTDNGTQFTSIEFQNFLRSNDVFHTRTAPGHPATNGLAERYVGHFKKKISQMKDTNDSLKVKLDKFLFTYRVTPTTLGKSPAELLMNRQPKTRFDVLRSQNLKQQVKVFQDNLDFCAKFKQEQAVFALNFGKGPKWLPGIVLKELSPRNYEIQVYDAVWKRHETQLRNRVIPLPLLPRKELDESFIFPEIPTQTQQIPLTATVPEPPTVTVPAPQELTTGEVEPLKNAQELNKQSSEPSSTQTASSSGTSEETVQVKRYPTRERRKPQRLIEQ